jgi:hypothetical protein
MVIFHLFDVFFARESAKIGNGLKTCLFCHFQPPGLKIEAISMSGLEKRVGKRTFFLTFLTVCRGGYQGWD